MENTLEFQEDTQKGKFLTFSLEEEDYGMEIKYVTEVIRLQPITQVPELPEHVRGIINLRGKIVPVMDVKLRFKKESKKYHQRTCIIVVDIKDISIGLIVDSISEVIAIPEHNIVPPPMVNKGMHNKYIKGIGKVENQVKLILDCEKLIEEGKLENLSGAL